MLTPDSRELVVLDQVSRLLAEAVSLDDIKSIRDKAEALRKYAKAAQRGLEVQNRAARLKLEAERKAGNFLASLHLRGGDRKSKGHDVPLILEDLGISRSQSKRWQRIALVSESDFNQYLNSANTLGQEITSAGLLRITQKARDIEEAGAEATPANRSKNSVEEIQTSAEEPFQELTNHLQTLERVLQPSQDGAGLYLDGSQTRIIGRVIREMAGFLRQVERGLQHQNYQYQNGYHHRHQFLNHPHG